VPGGMKILRHHGKERVTDICEIEAVNIVLTTYHTISADWTKKSSGSNVMFSVRWKRIILDEGEGIGLGFIAGTSSDTKQLTLSAI
jgi:hypothetical protein